MCLIKTLGAAWVKVTVKMHIVIFLHQTKEKQLSHFFHTALLSLEGMLSAFILFLA